MSSFFEVHHKLIGEDSQANISSSHIAIVGIGGLGCSVAMGLVRLGVKNLTLMDHDEIEASNIPRQILFDHSDVGFSKVTVAKQKLSQIFDDLNIATIKVSISAKNGTNHLNGADIVIDCTDNHIARYAISRCCETLDIPMIYGGVEGFNGQVGVFSLHGSKPFHVLFPKVEALVSNEQCNASGVLPFVVQSVGNLQVIEAYKIIRDEDNILNNRLLCINVLTGKQRIINLDIKK